MSRVKVVWPETPFHFAQKCRYLFLLNIFNWSARVVVPVRKISALLKEAIDFFCFWTVYNSYPWRKWRKPPHVSLRAFFFCYVRWYFSLFYNIKIHRGYLFGIFTIGSECGWCNILRCDFPLHHHRPAGSDPFFFLFVITPSGTTATPQHIYKTSQLTTDELCHQTSGCTARLVLKKKNFFFCTGIFVGQTDWCCLVQSSLV